MTFGCRGNTTHTEISLIKAGTHKGWRMSGNVVMFVPSNSELSSKLTNSTDAGDYMLGPIREENRIVDRLLYVDPYVAVSETVAYLMLYSKTEEHFNKECLPTVTSTSHSGTCLDTHLH